MPPRLLDLYVTITYERDKGTECFKFCSGRSQRVLLNDTETLGFPAYLENHVRVVSPGTVEIVWRDVEEGGKLHHTLENIIRPYGRRNDSQEWREKLHLREIVDVMLEVNMIGIGEASHTRSSDGHRFSTKRPYESSGRPRNISTSHSPYKRARGDSYSESHLPHYDGAKPSFLSAESSSRAGHEIQRPMPNTSLVDRVGSLAARERPAPSLVKRISPAPSAFQSRLSERISPAVGPDAPAHPAGSLSSRISGPPPATSLLATSVQLPTSEPTNTRPATPSDTSANQTDAESAPEAPSRSSHISRFGPLVGISSLFACTSSQCSTSRSTLKVNAAASYNAQSSATAAELPSIGTHPSQLSAPLHIEDTTTASSKDNVPSVGDNDDAEEIFVEAAILPAESHRSVASTIKQEPPLATKKELSSTIPLAGALLGIHEGVTPRSEVEEAELYGGQAGSSTMVPPVASSPKSEIDSLRAQLAVATKELEDAKEDLERERRLREEAEATVADVKRECAQPFMVPAIYDAFVQISRLTTKAQQLSNSSKGGAI